MATTPEYFDDPHTCPWCLHTEPNAFLLQNNHWVKTARGSDFDWCETHGLCIAMDLTRNHVLYYARRITDPSYGGELCACSSSRHAPRVECARAGLERCLRRVRQVWPLPRQHWISEYEALVTPRTVPEHHQVPASEELMLFGGAA